MGSFFQICLAKSPHPSIWLRLAEPHAQVASRNPASPKPIPQFTSQRFFFSLRFNTLRRNPCLARTPTMRFSYQKGRIRMLLHRRPSQPNATPLAPEIPLRPPIAFSSLPLRKKRLFFAFSPAPKIELSTNRQKSSFPPPEKPYISRFSTPLLIAGKYSPVSRLSPTGKNLSQRAPATPHSPLLCDTGGES
jgi:hypothetical protein